MLRGSTLLVGRKSGEITMKWFIIPAFWFLYWTVPVYTFGIITKPPMIWHFCFFHQWFCLAVRETP